MKRFKKTNIEISHDTMCIKFLRFLIFNDLEKINVLKKTPQASSLPTPNLSHHQIMLSLVLPKCS